MVVVLCDIVGAVWGMCVYVILCSWWVGWFFFILFGGYYVYALVVDFGGALYVYFYKGGLIW